jgi:hypothetical protein
MASKAGMICRATIFDEILADKACAGAVQDVYLGGDLSDPRLGRLRELPNLKSIVFLFAEKPDALLESLRGVATIEGLCFDHTRLTGHNVDQIASLPSLKRLCFSLNGLRLSDLLPLRHHPSLERLVVTEVSADQNMIGLLQSMPRLRCVGVGARSHGKQPQGGQLTEESLRKALPGCECSLWEDDR